MSSGIWQLVIFVIILGLVTKPLGDYRAVVYEGRRTFLSGLLLPAERLAYRLVRFPVSSYWFFPTLSLAPIAEHYLMNSGVFFP